MMNNNATIAQYMSSAPHTIGQEQTIAKAGEMMRQYKIRHLPVLEGGSIVGVLSERDIALIESMKDVDPHKVTVEEAMSAEPYIVKGDVPLQQVATEMAEHKYGSAVVVDGNKVVGMFTTVDACRVLTEVLSKK